jgi:uncharacterized membrane protein
VVKVGLRGLLLLLLALFCVAYPIAVIGVAFDVRPPFSLAWAGAALLFLEGGLLLVSAMLLYGIGRALVAGLIVFGCSYFVEALGVRTGFPFGIYHYTNTLQPQLPGSVPLAVMFAWMLVIFGSYSWVKRWCEGKRGTRVGAALLGALLATALDLAIEPVASHVVLYWVWQTPGPLHYYGVPFANFVAWFVVAFVLMVCVASVFERRQRRGYSKMAWRGRKGAGGTDLQLAALAPRLLFACSLFMFSIVDLTHGFYWACLPGLVAGFFLWRVAMQATSSY